MSTVEISRQNNVMTLSSSEILHEKHNIGILFCFEFNEDQIWQNKQDYLEDQIDPWSKTFSKRILRFG